MEIELKVVVQTDAQDSNDVAILVRKQLRFNAIDRKMVPFTVTPVTAEVVYVNDDA